VLTRYVIGVALGAFVTFALFLLMQALIKSDRSPFTDAPRGGLLDFVRLQEEQELITKDRKPKPPPPPDEPPPDMPRPDFDTNVSMGVEIGAVNMDMNVEMSGTGGFSSDGEYLPIVKVAPVYPRRALTRGIEGYVILEFTVTKLGTVMDPVVIEAKPSGIFDRAAIQAALKFKYKPKVVDGEPIEVHGVRNIIRFELEDAGGGRG
jgi:protein TonB